MTQGSLDSPMSCSKVAPLLDTFVDGELTRELNLVVQQHLDGCRRCNETVGSCYAWKQSLRGAVREAAPVTPEFLARVQGALSAQQRNIEERKRLRRLGADRGPLSWHAIVPLVAAAACALFWVRSKSVQEPMLSRSSESRPAQASLLDDAVLDELIDYHSAPPASQVTEPALVPQLERDVGVRVYLPVFDNTRWVQRDGSKALSAQPVNNAPQLRGVPQRGVPEWHGAAVVPVRNYRAAYLRYKVDGHSVTLYMYNSGRFPVHRKLEERMVHDQPVYVGERRGYSIAARERKGIGYAVATDLDATQSAELVASIH